MVITIWKKILGYDFLYEYEINENCFIKNPITKRILKPYTDKRRKYCRPYFNLTFSNGKQNKIYADDLMFETFFDKIDGIRIYKDSNNKNLSLSNLSIGDEDEFIKSFIIPKSNKIFDEDERWKLIKIDNKQTNYFVSSYGRVFNFKRKEIVSSFDADSRIKISVNGLKVNFTISRLVYQYFVGEIKENENVFHKNGENNFYKNLYTKIVEYIDWDYPNEEIIYDSSNTKWRKVKIKGYKNNYFVSEYGAIYNIKSKKIEKQHYKLKNNGLYYMEVIMEKEDGTKTSVFTHRIVAFAFVDGYSKHRIFVNHIDGIPYNNHYTNLEWVNNSENLLHAYRTGLSKPLTGSDVYINKWSEEEINMLCYLISLKTPFDRLTDIMNKFGMHITVDQMYNLYRNIVTHKCWKYISSLYSI